jgi:neurofibromin 1
VLGLAADCCSAQWQAVNEGAVNGSAGIHENGGTKPKTRQLEVLEDTLVIRIFDIMKQLLDPLPDGYTIPARSLLDETTANHVLDPPSVELPPRSGSSSGSDEADDSFRAGDDTAKDVEPHIRTIVEYVSASSWPPAFEYLKRVIYLVRTAAPPQPGVPQPLAVAEEERYSLVVLRLLSYVWIDSIKLGAIIQELCSVFLHFRKSFQATVAVVTPLLIIRWLDRYPEEFIRLHSQRKRLDGGPDTLFDMTLTLVENGRRRNNLYPMQMALLFLVPDVFEVASNLREAKGINITKKVQFLESLRKALRNKNEAAGWCLVALLRAARHFNIESDSAIAGYAMDVQDEVKDAVFRRTSISDDGFLFEQDLTTVAFISLSHLSFEISVDTLVDACLHSSAPPPFKIAIIQACSYFARQNNSEDYRTLFSKVAGFIQEQLKVSRQYMLDHIQALFLTIGRPCWPRSRICTLEIRCLDARLQRSTLPTLG